jgi:hypothetical protein
MALTHPPTSAEGTLSEVARSALTKRKENNNKRRSFFIKSGNLWGLIISMQDKVVFEKRGVVKTQIFFLYNRPLLKLEIICTAFAKLK